MRSSASVSSSGRPITLLSLPSTRATSAAPLALERVGARLVERLAARDVSARARPRAAARSVTRLVDAALPHARASRVVRDRDRREHAVRAAGEPAEQLDARARRRAACRAASRPSTTTVSAPSTSRRGAAELRARPRSAFARARRAERARAASSPARGVSSRSAGRTSKRDARAREQLAPARRGAREHERLSGVGIGRCARRSRRASGPARERECACARGRSELARGRESSTRDRRPRWAGVAGAIVAPPSGLLAGVAARACAALWRLCASPLVERAGASVTSATAIGSALPAASVPPWRARRGRGQRCSPIAAAGPVWMTLSSRCGVPLTRPQILARHLRIGFPSSRARRRARSSRRVFRAGSSASTRVAAARDRARSRRVTLVPDRLRARLGADRRATRADFDARRAATSKPGGRRFAARRAGGPRESSVARHERTRAAPPADGGRTARRAGARPRRPARRVRAAGAAHRPRARCGRASRGSRRCASSRRSARARARSC